MVYRHINISLIVCQFRITKLSGGKSKSLSVSILADRKRSGYRNILCSCLKALVWLYYMHKSFVVLKDELNSSQLVKLIVRLSNKASASSKIAPSRGIPNLTVICGIYVFSSCDSIV